MTMTAAAKPRIRVPAYHTETAAPAVATDSGRMEAFTFGDPEPVTSMRDVWYEGVWLTPDEWYEPPIPLSIRFIPTPVGNGNGGSVESPTSAVHPHACGERPQQSHRPR